MMRRRLKFGSRPWRHLTSAEKQQLQPYIAQVDLDSALLHEAGVPWYLGERFVAVTRGHRIYFRIGAYDASMIEGIALLGHELVHVGQYRLGMTALHYLTAARRGYRTNPYEQVAFALGDRIRADLA